jgi:NTE family protein
MAGIGTVMANNAAQEQAGTMADTGLANPERVTRSGDPTVAIAFGGGGARGIAHIHIIETLNAMGIEPVAISGSSIGAIMGAAMASGLSGAEIRELPLAASASRQTRSAGCGKRRVRAASVMRWRAGLRLGQFNIERILEEFLPE